jgi:lysine 2,3-aminomutase
MFTENQTQKRVEVLTQWQTLLNKTSHVRSTRALPVTTRLKLTIMLSHITKAQAFVMRAGRLTAASTSRPYRASNPFTRRECLTTSAPEAIRRLGNDPARLSATTDGPSTTAAAASMMDNANGSQALLDQQDEFWRKTPVWADTSAKDFLSYRWSVSWITQTHLTLITLIDVPIGRKRSPG